MRIDLHTHSTVSDGTATPTEVIKAADGAGLNVVALTDHDTTSGWAEAAAALPVGLTLRR
jgi:predicted metal-dependent phosphoesterase TrpH